MKLPPENDRCTERKRRPDLSDWVCVLPLSTHRNNSQHWFVNEDRVDSAEKNTPK